MATRTEVTVLKAGVRTLAGVLVALALGAGPAHAQGADPLAPGPYGYKKIEYSAGNLMITIPPANGTASQTFPQPLEGSIIYPDTPGPWKVLVFMHGRHSTCITGTGGESSPPITSPDVTCDDTDNPDGTENTTKIQSWQGYDYLSTNLASHGYVVMSVSANTIVSFDNTFSYDAGANARSQVLAASLDLLYRWNNGEGPVVAGDDYHTVGTKLTGKMEMQRVGLMGHSRGGEGVTDFIRFNRLRPSGRIYNLQAVMALAPIDSQKQVPLGTNFGVILPACDGDVSTLSGANAYERSKYPNGADAFAKVQFYVQGADHNYFNTIWTNDDGASYSGTGSGADVACGEDKPNSIRLFPADQRKVGLGLMAAFLRDYLGMEKQFEPMMTGAAGLPASACPTLRGVACSEEVKTSYIAPAAQRQDIIKPEASMYGTVPTPLVSADSAGGELTATGFATFDACNEDRDQITGVQIKPCPTNPSPNSTTSTNRSYGRQLTLAWDGPAALRAELAGSARNAARFGALSLRAAVNFGDLRNPISNGTNPASAMQDFDVVLIDRAGKESSVRAARYGTALEPSLGSFRRHVVLNGLRIPLTAFSGVDLTDLRAVELRFGAATARGSIQLADVAFQEPPAATAPAPDAASVAPLASAPDAASVAPLPGPKRVDGIAVSGVTTVPSKTACADSTAPRSSVAALRLTGGRLVASGTASDTGCHAAGRLAARAGKLGRVQISVTRSVAGRCQFLRASGRLTAATSCSAPLALIAKGAKRWSLKSAAKLPAGTYTVRIQAIDARGNLEPAKTRTLRAG
ncbi:hypothetical protein [Solirubrobacter ginsenosidimutans]|uniref:hypothetical protein n=1 Tax=Solirubrobacter ginsenosidimutans TaxID=490573 RepID=UPI0022CDD7BE|nr:hypothetical protein [Solirubrobacter ginsenosidimutans]